MASSNVSPSLIKVCRMCRPPPPSQIRVWQTLCRLPETTFWLYSEANDAGACRLLEERFWFGRLTHSIDTDVLQPKVEKAFLEHGHCLINIPVFVVAYVPTSFQSELFTFFVSINSSFSVVPINWYNTNCVSASVFSWSSSATFVIQKEPLYFF